MPRSPEVHWSSLPPATHHRQTVPGLLRQMALNSSEYPFLFVCLFPAGCKLKQERNRSVKGRGEEGSGKGDGFRIE